MTCPSNAVSLPFGSEQSLAAADMVRLTDALRFYRTDAKLFRFRLPKIDLNGDNWRTRLSMIYAVSVWAMIGSVAYMQWLTGTFPKPSKTDYDEDSEKDRPPDIPEDRKEIPTFTTTIVYKENFVPYTTRLMQYLNSFKDSSSEK